MFAIPVSLILCALELSNAMLTWYREWHYFFFFFSIQQNFRTEDYFMVCMRDNWFKKYIYFCILHLSQWIIYKLFIFIYFLFLTQFLVKLCTLKSLVYRSG